MEKDNEIAILSLAKINLSIGEIKKAESFLKILVKKNNKNDDDNEDDKDDKDDTDSDDDDDKATTPVRRRRTAVVSQQSTERDGLSAFINNFFSSVQSIFE